MAAITADVRSIPRVRLGTDNVPTTCSQLDRVHHANFFAVTIDQDTVRPSSEDSELYVFDYRIAAAWNWMMVQGRLYLLYLIDEIGPYGSEAFYSATTEIDVPVDHWLPYLAGNAVDHYLGPLDVPGTFDSITHYARRARGHLLCMFSFISLIRRRTLGRSTTIQVPENDVEWRAHALSCSAAVRPRIDHSDFMDEIPAFAPVLRDEAHQVIREQLQRLHEWEDTVGRKDQRINELEQQAAIVHAHNAILSRDLIEAVGEKNGLLTELGQAKAALKKTLGRLHLAHARLSAYSDDEFDHLIQLPLPDDFSDVSVDTPSNSSSPIILIPSYDSDDATSAFADDEKH
ncbi:hypothetical protein FRB90_000290 [Tulasnella sp. 427]|nr:hypothetical protein FRB90_000290 [Tulasnella sp. 427]